MGKKPKMVFFIKLIRTWIWKINVRLKVKFMSTILNGQKIELLDVGALGGIEPRWKQYLKHISYNGVEADNRHYGDFKKSNLKIKDISNIVVGKTTTKANFFISKQAGKSSLMKPNLKFLNKFADVERFRTIKKKVINVYRLDKIIDRQPDFVKLDIQGSELDALIGLGKFLDNVIGIEAEVEFFELYEGQPCFEQINRFLSEKGFVFVDFTNLRRWARGNHGGIGQLVFGDALWIRDTDWIAKKPKLWQKYLSILAIYSRFDFSKHFIEKVGKDRIGHPSIKLHDKIGKRERFWQKNIYYFSKIFSFIDPNTSLHLIR